MLFVTRIVQTVHILVCSHRMASMEKIKANLDITLGVKDMAEVFLEKVKNGEEVPEGMKKLIISIFNTSRRSFLVFFFLFSFEYIFLVYVQLSILENATPYPFRYHNIIV